MPESNGEEVVMDSAGQAAGLIVREKLFCTLWGANAQLSVAVTVKENVPTVVGVPEMSPVELRLKPVGSEPDARV